MHTEFPEVQEDEIVMFTYFVDKPVYLFDQKLFIRLLLGEGDFVVLDAGHLDQVILRTVPGNEESGLHERLSDQVLVPFERFPSD